MYDQLDLCFSVLQSPAERKQKNSDSSETVAHGLLKYGLRAMATGSRLRAGKTLPGGARLKRGRITVAKRRTIGSTKEEEVYCMEGLTVEGTRIPTWGLGQGGFVFQSWRSSQRSVERATSSRMP